MIGNIVSEKIHALEALVKQQDKVIQKLCNEVKEMRKEMQTQSQPGRQSSPMDSLGDGSIYSLDLGGFDFTEQRGMNGYDDFRITD